MELQDANLGEAITSIKGIWQGVGDATTDHIKSCSNCDPPSEAEVAQSG